MATARRSCFRSFLVVLVGCFFAAFQPSVARAENREVVVPETPVRSAPFDVAPEIARLRAGDKINATDQPQGEWRRVALPDGRFGFLREADTQPAENAPAPAAPPSAAAAPDAQPPPPAPPPAPALRAEAAQPTGPGPHLLGVMFELLPVGTLAATSSTGVSTSADSVFAVGIAPFFDGAVSPYFALGLSPQMLFRVKNDGNTIESAKQFDVRARATARLPLSPRVRVFGRVSPAYSIILLPTPPPSATTATNTDRPNPHGFLIGFATGVEIAVLPNFFIVTDLGYQAGYQSSTDGDLQTSYLHLGAGFAIGL